MVLRGGGDPTVPIDVAADCEFVGAADDRVDGVVTVTIDRPDARNALNATVRSELKTVLQAIGDGDGDGDRDGGHRVVVITGADAAKAFVAGADVTEFPDRDVFEQRAVSEGDRVYDLVADLDIPTIARINGHALGGGCELALACDVRIAHERAKLGQPEINLGIIPGGGATQRLPRLVGTGQALRLILSGELIDAEEASEIGLVEECHPDGTFDERVYELAGSMAEKSKHALVLAKRAVRASDRMPIDAGIDHERELFLHQFNTPDKDEGIRAFLEDRDPEWTDRA